MPGIYIAGYCCGAEMVVSPALATPAMTLETRHRKRRCNQMNSKKMIACGMLLGLLTAVSFAQHQRVFGGGTMPGAHPPNNVHSGGNLGVPNTTTLNKGSITSSGRQAGVTRPNATTDPNAQTVRPNADPKPDHVSIPDARGLGNDTNAVGRH